MSTRVRRRARRFGGLLAAIGLVAGSAVLIIPSAASAAVGAAQPVTKSATVSRFYVSDDGSKTTLDQRTVSVTVSATTNLRSLQLVNVTWSGAHPTGGIVGDPNSDKSQNQEYPMVLLECRGTDAANVAADKQVTPSTCWTQFADERFFGTTVPFPAWRSDASAAPAQRAATVNAPDGATLAKTTCPSQLFGVLAQRWVPFVGADGTVYPGGPQACGGLAPEAATANLSSLALPSNETFGVTDKNGSGSASFDIFTAEDHASLGCSQSVACTLEAIPIEGINCDPSGVLSQGNDQPGPDDISDAISGCETAGNFDPGDLLPAQKSGQTAVDGRLWWSPSNWNRRISFPLTFAQPDNVCSVLNQSTPTNVYGSELLAQATTQWAPHFCLDSKSFNFNHVYTPEPEARSLLATGNISAAFTSEPPDVPYSKPTVQAPTAVTGFGVAFQIDDANLHQVTSLKLDARLLAKLLTMSYPDQSFVKSGDAPLSANPLNMTYDPEFQALNPGIPEQAIDGAATLLTLDSDSDLVYALTSYINADPEARAWLNGTPDPWGMVVNPNYKRITLPTKNWPVNDSYEPLDVYSPGHIDCLYGNPVPYLPLVAAPVASLIALGQDMEFGISPSQTVCLLPSPIPGDLTGAKMVAVGRQPVGFRFMLGTVSLGDAFRDGIPLASLETSSSVDPSTKITNSNGRTFVAPTNDSLQRAAALLKPDATTSTWPIPYAAMRNNPADAGAYPGTMVVYTDVPTTGLNKADATNLADLIRFDAGAGQAQGATPGTLPVGYLPMTAANGLGSLVTYANRAADAVAAQSGTVPSVTGTETGGGSSGTGRGSTAGSGRPRGGIGNAPHVGGGGTAPAHTTSSAPSKSAASSPAVIPAAKRFPTKPLGAGVAGVFLPVLLVLVITFGGGAIALRLRGPEHGP